MKKSRRIELRCSDLDKKIIQIKAQECNVSISEYLLNCATNRKLPRVKSEEELSAFLELKKFQTNFIRISNFIKKYNDEEFKREVRELLDEVKKIKLFKNG